ncbi:MAG: tRNA (5-methylaminomethyl-2-thiouridylate)-methyltransferase [Rickettsiella sp.]|nr:tRNA (5-methylaminomethyl-2-thiouridylate)-methyltransferase [Rickettsiella sp.]
MKKAIALISGGLDSMLAARVVQAQGIHVEGINFYTGFCIEGHTHAIRNTSQNKPKRNNALWVAEQLGIKLHIIDIIQEYKQIVLNPKHGYGAHLNPCLDCKIFMVNKAKRWMEAHEFDFIITGEVIGQRPKSQLKKAMPIVAKESQAEDRLLRPLCAKLLAPTLPERESWVDRDKLYDFSGRSRTPQFDLAKQFNFKDYAQPAGGCCFLTNGHYTQKLKDLWKHRGKRDYEFDDIVLLKVGRHIRPACHFKLIIGRDEGENQFLEAYQQQFTSLKPITHLGPLTLIDGHATAEDMQLAAQIAARFTQAETNEHVTFEINSLSGSLLTMTVVPFTTDQICKEWYISG